MKLAAGAAVLGLVVLVFVLTTPPDPSAVEQPEAVEEATTTTEAMITRAGPPSVSRVLGVLPDGTGYSIRIDPGVEDQVTGVSLGIAIGGDGGLNDVGTAVVSFDGEESDNGGQYRFESGQVAVAINFFDHILEQLGPDAEQIITSSIHMSTTRGLPVFELDPPFRFGAFPPLQVRYQTFIVQPGCDAEAVACSATGAVQVVPRFSFSSDLWPDPQVTISANAPRPEWHHTFLDPGPLSSRTGYDVVWTGSEMLVWGGISEDGFLTDGAAFDPDANLWHMLSPPPIAAEQPTIAAWAGDVMVVVSEDATLAYEPGSDTWTTVGEGRVPVRDSPPPVWDGELLYFWQNEVERLDPATGEWQVLPDPPLEVNPNPQLRSLHLVEEGLFAASGPDPCGGSRSLARWDGAAWTVLPEPDLSGRFRDCSPPRHTGVVGQWLMVWNGTNGTALRLNERNGDWDQAHGLPPITPDLAFTGLTMGERYLVAHLGQGAVYRLDRNQWRRVALPGWGDTSQMVWTGEEVLMWSSDDAWRWRPPGG